MCNIGENDVLVFMSCALLLTIYNLFISLTIKGMHLGHKYG